MQFATGLSSSPDSGYETPYPKIVKRSRLAWYTPRSLRMPETPALLWEPLHLCVYSGLVDLMSWNGNGWAVARAVALVRKADGRDSGTLAALLQSPPPVVCRQ